ncbi:MAG: C39 family peptidase, partial [Patescibacteria group bacterium]
MKNKQITIGLVVGALLLGGFALQRYFSDPTKDSSSLNIHGPTSSPTSIPTKTPTSTANPVGKKVIDVPFTSQAPYAKWDALHQEMCEEGTLVMAHAWVSNISLTPAYAEQEIQKLAKWGTDNFGTYIDTSAAQTAQMGQKVYGLRTRLIQKPTVQQIKDEIDLGNIVIMGMTGRTLGNPNYTPPGPLYHMLLIKGYDATGFITNDDGTRNGNSYHYSY